jgi:hypothetical protein
VQEPVDRLPHRLVHHQSLTAGIDERQLEQARDGPLDVGLREHGPQQRLGDPPHDRCRFQRPPRLGVLDIGQVQPGQLGDDARGRGVFQRELGMLGHAGGGEDEGQRVTTRDAVEPHRIRCPGAVHLQQRSGVVVAERTQGEASELAPQVGEPAGDW